jgi:hypothetical protein
MPPQRKRSTVRWLSAALAVAALIGGAVALADPGEFERSHRGPAPALAARSRPAGESSPAVAPAPGSPSSAPSSGGRACGAATQRTIAAVDARVARKIYVGELVGHEVRRDVAHVTGSQQLLSAVAAGDQAAAYQAVHAIVYTPHWHIVRLRVVKNGRVLADVGGPDVIAPIAGSLRQGAAKVGSFVVSVQDDVGYVKLVTRFVGVPIELYGGPSPRPVRQFLMGTLQPAPALPSDGATVKAQGASYLARLQRADAFPSGTLNVALLVPAPSASLSAQSCTDVRDAAWLSVVEHVAARYSPLATHYQDLAGTLSGSTGGMIFVREGARQRAGLSAGPRRLPTRGVVSYRGRSWHVVSWSPYPPARIYFLAPS